MKVSDLSDAVTTHSAVIEAHNMLGEIDAVVHIVGTFDWIPVSDSS